jgi:hypothetical protein
MEEKRCVDCGLTKPVDDFQKTAHGNGRVSACKQCMGQRIRAGQIAKGTFSSLPQRPAVPAVTEPGANGHTHYWYTGSRVEQEFPDFYEANGEPPRGAEWQVCRCGEAKLVQVYDIGQDGPPEGTVLQRHTPPVVRVQANRNGRQAALSEPSASTAVVEEGAAQTRQLVPADTRPPAEWYEAQIHRLEHELKVARLELRVRDLRDELRAAEAELAEMKGVTI